VVGDACVRVEGLSGEQSVMAEPGFDVIAVLGDLFTLDGQAGTDLRASAGPGV
jgi:hypothetical protein